MAPPNTALADQQQTINAEPAKNTLQDDSEHESNPKPAKNASNAALRKEAKKTTHAASDAAGFGTAEAGLTALAAQYYAWKPEIDREVARNSGAGSSGPGIEFLTKTLQSADSMSWRVLELINQSDNAMKPKLGAVVQKAMGAMDAVQHSFEHANDWLKDRGEKQAADIIQIRTRIYQYANDISSNGLQADSVKPTSNLNEAMAGLIEHDLISIKADISSVKAGNSGDASRLNIHVTNLELNTRVHADVLKAKMKETGVNLHTLATALHELDEQPEYHGRFAESVLKLRQLAK